MSRRHTPLYPLAFTSARVAARIAGGSEGNANGGNSARIRDYGYCCKFAKRTAVWFVLMARLCDNAPIFFGVPGARPFGPRPEFPCGSARVKMQTLSTPTCPQCASPKLTTISASDQYPPVGSPAWKRRRSKPDSKLYTYQCQCGASFTHSVVYDGDGNPQW